MRIASLTCSNTEIVCALGLADQLVAIDDHSDHPESICRQVDRVGPDLTIDIEALAATQPDIVLASLTVPGHEKVVAQLQQRGLPHVAPDPRSLADVFRDVRTIAELLEVRGRGEALCGWMERGLQPAAGYAGPPIPILVEWWPRPVFVPGRHSWVNEMLELAGATNPWKEQPAHSLVVSAEDALEKDPRAVVISWCGIEASQYKPQKVIDRPGWQQVAAVLQQQVYCIPEAYLGRPGPRLVDGVRRLRAVVDQLQERD
ncbi:MAG: helical backbone metal receptor [Planctomycetota bacterium]|nr:helical backbone metal receptor [Planctomycetota bacterium]